MSTIHEVYEDFNALDYITEQLTITLIKNQELSLRKLRQLTLLCEDTEERGVFCEILVLSLIKFLELDSAFKIKIREETESYRIFNAMQLNDASINSMFCKFVAVIAPEVMTSISMVTAQIAAKLSARGSTRFTQERLDRLEAKINNLIAEGADNDVSKYLVEKKPKESRVRVRRSKKHHSDRKQLTFRDFLPTGARSSGRRDSIGSTKTRSSHSAKSETRTIVRKTTPVTKIRLSQSDHGETAEETAARLASLRIRETQEIPNLDTTKFSTAAEFVESNKSKGKGKVEDIAKYEISDSSDF